jgi:LmbE family N-acetylglucosaminyl deacetylase
MPSVLAIAAHPDDIEIMMAGTLLRLQQVGWDIHYFNLANGCCGSLEMDAAETARVRLEEAREAATLLGAVFYPPITRDLEILFGTDLLRKVAAVVRLAAPSIVLTHSPQDYMEDHMETCRLAVTAAFTHSMPNFRTDPSLPPHPAQGDVTVYHALPHGLRDGLRQAVTPDCFVDVTQVHPQKLKALAAHRSQQNWLDASQGMNSYLRTMEETSREVGRMSGKYELAEGWRRHLHYGFSRTEVDPLAQALALG